VAPGTPPAGGGARSAIAVSALSKSFRTRHERHSSVRDRVLHPLRRERRDVLQALDEVSFEVRPGEFFGVVGRNGSGKSTLLRCLSGIYQPDAGEIAVEGRLASFIELGVGFHPELSARDNALISAVMFGMSAREAAERFDEMLAFAELEEFRDLKLHNYSSGMAVRLAFAVTTHVDADVLLFDEVLAVGDSSFQRKCFDRFEQLKAEGRTVVLVTHAMGSVTRFCDRALLLDRGRVAAVGDPERIAAGYEDLNARGAAPGTPPERPASARPRDRSASRRQPWGWRRALALTRTLAVTQFRLRYLDSALSYLWALARPLSLFAVLYVVFTQLGRFDEGVEHYHLYLLTSIVLWTYFGQATAAAVQSLPHRGALLRKVPAPPVAVPLSVVLAAFFDLCLNLLAVFVFMLAAGVEPRAGWLELPLLLGLLTALVTGLALLLSALYVRLRDVNQVWQVVSQALFYLSPIFYVASALPDRFEQVALMSPIASIMTEARHALVDPDAPSAAEAIGGWEVLMVPVGIVGLVLALGVWVFRRRGPWLAEEL
jgi:ABC-type polysaccharide/polyol phosphate transport system ATPase subunit/ABC-type polysaccharide/polyol phosphate export permease